MKTRISRALGAKAKQAGFTAIEVMVVLTVGLGIIALSSGKLDMLFGGSNLTEEVSNINTLLVNIKSLKTTSGYGAAGTDLTTQLSAIGGVPRNISVASNVMYNNWGGTIVPKSTGTGFTIADGSLPMDVCIKIATKTSKSGAFSTIAINANGAITGEVTSAVATTQCNSAAANLLTFAAAS